MPVLYAESVDCEIFLERFDERVVIPEPGTIFQFDKYYLYMMLLNVDRTDRTDPSPDDINYDEHIYAKCPVSLPGDRRVCEEEGLRKAGFVVVSLLGKLGTHLSFDRQNLVEKSQPQPHFSIEINGGVFRAPYRVAFLHIDPYTS